ncbi:MAG: hypothetical protein IJ220_05920 [Clostridia bacterium]|nr:hypothetical protein [Clostridia bacterium]
MKNAKDNMFVLIEASKLSLDDKFMQHRPTSDNERRFKKLLTKAIKNGLSDFWVSTLDPSFNEDKTNIVFEAGKMPAVGKSYNWWEKKADEYLPERGSHLGTKKERIAFLGVLIKTLVERGSTFHNSWKAVCDDSIFLGHYRNSVNAKFDFEVTGSREICGFCDLANTYKILAWDKEAGGFWLAGSCYCNYGDYFPLASLFHYTHHYTGSNYSVGWIVLSK